MPVAGTNPYTVIFIPEDTQNYNSITAEIFITVNKAVPEYTIPTDLTAVKISYGKSYTIGTNTKQNGNLCFRL